MEPFKHSGPGIWSFIVSIVSAIFMMIIVVAAGVATASSPYGMDESVAIVIGFFMIAFLFVTLVALGLGIGGLVQKERKKIFAIIGTVISALTICGVGILMLIGLMA
jgi:hypothetical protein